MTTASLAAVRAFLSFFISIADLYAESTEVNELLKQMPPYHGLHKFSSRGIYRERTTKPKDVTSWKTFVEPFAGGEIESFMQLADLVLLLYHKSCFFHDAALLIGVGLIYRTIDRTNQRVENARKAISAVLDVWHFFMKPIRRDELNIGRDLLVEAKRLIVVRHY